MQKVQVKMNKQKRSCKADRAKSPNSSYNMYMPRIIKSTKKLERESKTFIRDFKNELYGYKESVTSTRDHSTKRSLTPGNQIYGGNRVNSVNLKVRNFDDSFAKFDKKTRIDWEGLNKDVMKKIKKIRGNAENRGLIRDYNKIIVSNSGAYKSPRQITEAFKSSGDEERNRTKLEDVKRFFEEFHEKSKNLLMKFEKTIKESS